MANRYSIKKIKIEGNLIAFSYMEEIDGLLYWLTDIQNSEFKILITDKEINIVSFKNYKISPAINAIGNIISIHKINTNEILIGGSIYQEAIFNHFIIKVNKVTNQIIWFKTYVNDLTHSLPNTTSKFLKINSNKFLIINNEIAFIIDGNGKILVKKSNRGITSLSDALIFSDKIIALFYTSDEREIQRILIWDQNLDQIDQVYYNVSNINNSGFAHKFNLEGMINGNKLIVFNNYKTKQYFFEYDLTKSFPDTIQGKSFVESADSYFLYNSNYFYKIANLKIPTQSETAFVIHKFDYNFQLIWSKKINEIDFTRTNIRLIDNEFYIQKFFSGNNSYQGITKLNNDFDNNYCVSTISLDPFSIENENASKKLYPYNQYNTVKVFNITSNNHTIDINTISGYQVEDNICPAPYNLESSIIKATPSQIEANGTSTSIITIQLKDASGTNITVGGSNVVISATKGTLSAITDNNNGTYTATLTSSIVEETSTASFSIGGENSPNTTTVTFFKPFVIGETTHLQSPHIYMQAAGSTGADGSLPGIHLRWVFKNKLGEQHLPKGNYAANTLNFNKPDDFVTIYRAPYVKNQVTIDLSTSPTLIDDQNALWIYKIENAKYFIHFRDQASYQAARNTIDPIAGSSIAFIQQYGNKLIEIESKEELAFSAELVTEDIVPSSSLQTELLGVEDNKFSASKNLIARKTFTTTNLSNTYQSAENIRSISFIASNCIVKTIKLELYSAIVSSLAWTNLGKYALTENDDEALDRLESSSGLIHGKWPRYNDSCFVNINNYKDRWNGQKEIGDRNLKQIVQKYIEFSNEGLNPKALENISYSETINGETLSDTLEVSNLDMLFIASLDYHMARMMGLGYLDTSANNDTYFYMAEYHTKAKLGDGIGKRDVQHLYISIPTTTEDERLPIPMDLKPPVAGIPRRGSNPNVQLTDGEGYTTSGKQRYISLYTKELKDYHLQSFYETEEEFNTSLSTTPVYAGIEYKKEGETQWRRPEISSTIDYYNASVPGENPIPETIPLSIPDKEGSLFVHRETEEGTHIYSSYGVNWFSRANQSTITHTITTTFKPDNRLLPPSGLNAVHIVKERPFVLTSYNEQVMLETNTRIDDTIVRLVFDYHNQQELVSYKVTKQDEAKHPNLLDPDAIFKDKDEVFAEEIELFFRNRVPQNITGKIKNVTTDPNNEILSIIQTENYLVHSTGERIIPAIPTGSIPSDFVGGVFVAGEDQYIIHSISIETGTSPAFVVYKKEIGDSIQKNNAPNPDTELQSPANSGAFMAIENMLSVSTWGSNNPYSFKIQLPNWAVHREIIIQKGADTDPEKILEKTRGIWDENTKITEVLEAKSVNDNNEVIEKIHKGLYKIECNQRLAQHSQFATNANSVEWYGGVIRIHTIDDPTGPRKILKVIKLENIGSNDNLIIYAIDSSFQPVTDQNTGAVISYTSENPIQTGTTISVNFYPGYRVYLYEDTNWGLTKENLTPIEGTGIKYSVFGLRSVDKRYTNSSGDFYRSPISTPGMMFTQEINAPQRPELPEGSLYATRPDSFGKATYTLTTVFKHNPHAILYYRADDQSILNALYNSDTVIEIKEKLNSYDKDIYFSSRWVNLLNFEYQYAADDPVNENGQFGIYPPLSNGYRFPNPDKPSLFTIINTDINTYNKQYNKNIPNVTPGTLLPSTIILPAVQNGEATTLIDYMKFVIFNAFTPLTEVPLLYSHIKNEPYQPTQKKQVIRDRNGRLLQLNDPNFDIAPMVKKLGNKKVLFTDFTLDGTSGNTYFYTTREMGNTLQMGDFSPVLGPIKLINTTAPETPEIRRTIPLLASANFKCKKIPLDFVDISNIDNSQNISLTKKTIDGWDAGASSKQILVGNGYCSYQVSTNASAMVGFSRKNQNDHFNTIEYALYANPANKLYVYEKGSNISEIGIYDEKSILKIARKGNKILFYKDEKLLYSSLILENTQEGFLLDIAMHKKDAFITNIELYSESAFYAKEILETTPIPITISNKENIEIIDNIITKIFGGNSWNAGANTDQYLPYYGSVEYKVLSNTNVMLGLASYNESTTINDLKYAIYAKEDGYLYAYKNGTVQSKCIVYDKDSVLSIERRNNIIVFKKDGRPFYNFEIEDNIPFLVDFSMYKLHSKIIDLTVNKIKKLVRSITPKSTTSPGVSIEINAYQKEQNIKKIHLYRALNPTNSLSTRTMDLIKTVDLILEDQINNSVWKITDEFLDLDFIPFGDPLFYRVTVSREVEYAKEVGSGSIIVTEHVPSKPSKLLISSIVESSSPIQPELRFGWDNDTSIGKFTNILLTWKKTVYNGKYHIYKMNSQGNWVKILEYISNEEEILLFLSDTMLNEDSLPIRNENSEPIFHHFKIEAENSAGMFSQNNDIITLPSDRAIAEEQGVGSMIVEHTNIIR